MTEQLSVAVIGAGMAGLATAARAAELGLNVLVVDQAATYGGSANVAGGTLLGKLSASCGHRPRHRTRQPLLQHRQLLVLLAKQGAGRHQPSRHTIQPLLLPLHHAAQRTA